MVTHSIDSTNCQPALTGWAKRCVRRSLVIAAIPLFAALSGTVTARSINDILKTDDNLTIFANAIEQSGLSGILSGSGSIAVFAPTNSAMKIEGSAFLLESVLLSTPNEARLIELLSHHILTEPHPTLDSAVALLTLQTHADSCLTVRQIGSGIQIGPESFVIGSVKADNGIIHLVDRLLWQPYDSRKCEPAI